MMKNEWMILVVGDSDFKIGMLMAVIAGDFGFVAQRAQCMRETE
jgi:hypothetical protein